MCCFGKLNKKWRVGVSVRSLVYHPLTINQLAAGRSSAMRSSAFDLTVIAEKWHECRVVFSEDSISRPKKFNELRSFSAAQEWLRFVFESTNYDRPRVPGYISAIWRAIITAVPPFEAPWRDLSNGVFIVLIGVLAELLSLQAKSRNKLYAFLWPVAG